MARQQKMRQTGETVKRKMVKETTEQWRNTAKEDERQAKME